MPEEPHAPAELIRRLPATFGPALNDQLRQWKLLFPAEQRQLQTQLDWLSRLPREQFDQLFAPLFDIESRMALPRFDSSTAGLSVRDTGILARSPLYPRWRGEVEKVFGRIDEATAASAGLRNLPRLLVCVLPPGSPVNDQPQWPDLDKNASWLVADRPFGEILPEFVSTVAKRACPPVLDEVERTWVFESDTRLSDTAGASVLSWEGLSALRREFLRRLNAVQRDLRSVDQTSEELKRADINRLLAPAMAANPRVREFVRTLLLSGNGSLLFGNSFVEWGASEALRRVQPQVLIASFGVRKKLKPFSSVVLFEDQNRSNPVPDEDDPSGSLVDAAILAQYVYLGAQRVACYPGHTVTLLAAYGSNRILVLSPPAAGFQDPALQYSALQNPALQNPPIAPKDLAALALRWLTPIA
jgi:hypothetical protein